jgi:hypothetical protein
MDEIHRPGLELERGEVRADELEARDRRLVSLAADIDVFAIDVEADESLDAPGANVLEAVSRRAAEDDEGGRLELGEELAEDLAQKLELSYPGAPHVPLVIGRGN